MAVTVPEGVPQDIERFLKGLQKEETPGHWGFTVYLTYPASTQTSISSPQSTSANDAFDRGVSDRFQAYISNFLRHTVIERFGVKVPLDIELIRLPSATVPEARRHFRAKYGWPEKYDKGFISTHEHHDMRHALFVVIDEETMTTWLQAPDPISEPPEGMRYEGATINEDIIMIKLVSVRYDEACGGIQYRAAGRGTPKNSPNSTTFYGHLKTTPRWLLEAWGMLMDFDFDMLMKKTDSVYKGQIGLLMAPR